MSEEYTKFITQVSKRALDHLNELLSDKELELLDVAPKMGDWAVEAGLDVRDAMVVGMVTMVFHEKENRRAITDTLNEALKGAQQMRRDGVTRNDVAASIVTYLEKCGLSPNEVKAGVTVILNKMDKVEH